MFGRGVSKDRVQDQLKVIRHELREIHDWKALMARGRDLLPPSFLRMT
jgi:hypothetical protein